MNRLTLLLLFVPIVSIGQIKKIEITNFSTIEPVVVEIPNKSTKELFDKSNDWINFTYKNPSSVIKGTVENDFLRFSGFKKSFASAEIGMGMTHFYDLNYTIRLDFKDGKYRFTLESYGIIYPATQYTSSTENTFESFKLPVCRNKKGELKKLFQMQYDSQSVGLLRELNEINESLYSYLTGETQQIKDDW